MLRFKSLTLKNFLSVGNVTQAVTFPSNTLTLVMGRNLDFQDTGCKNGVGKSTIQAAISYALYGNSLTDIKVDHLINDTNLKDMIVTLDFEVNGVDYRIVRGRKPAIFKFYVNATEEDNDSSNDEAQGDSKETQKHIEQIIDMSHEMFRNIVCLNTYTVPFLSQTAAVQRSISEQLLGITMLSEKAEALKKVVSDTKKAIEMEEVRIKSEQDANKRIEEQIVSLIARQDSWLTKQKNEILNFENLLTKMAELDIEHELESHKNKADRDTIQKELNSQVTLQNRLINEITREQNKIQNIEKEIVLLSERKCPACLQNLNDHNHDDLVIQKAKSLDSSLDIINTLTKEKSEIDELVSNLKEALETIPSVNSTFYKTQAEALAHKDKITSLATQYEAKIAESDPYQDQIESMKSSALVEISHDTINELIKEKEHQDFLLKLLTNKDSFIRKNIIDQNLSFLNDRLTQYVDQMGLNFQVYFQNDLAVSINKFGRERSFDNLSRGERTRLILALNFAFRDVWENLYHPINFMSVDELLDNGLDTVGVTNGLNLLNKYAHDMNKSVFLVSHREELSAKANNVLIAELENGFTTYKTDD